MTTEALGPGRPATRFAVGDRVVVPIVEVVGPGLPAARTYPELDPADLRALVGAQHSGQDTGELMLTMASQGFAILGAGRVIVVDTGLGGPKPGRPEPRPGLRSGWLDALRRAGVAAGDVDTVVTTHLHHDHVGWNTRWDGASLVPTFPRARYLLNRVEFGHSTRGTVPVQVRDSVLPLREAGLLDLVDLVDGELRLDDDVRLVAAPGHTPGHLLVEIGRPGRRALLAGDLLHHRLQLARPDISAAMCHDRTQSAVTRHAILDRYADTGTLFLPTHLPDGGYLVRQGSGYRLVPAAGA